MTNSTGTSWLIYRQEDLPTLKEGEAVVALGDGNHVIVDAGIADLVGALRAEGIDTLWSCQGGPGHMCQRPTVVARMCQGMHTEWSRIELVMSKIGVEDYWVSLVAGYGKFPTMGCLNSHGGHIGWLIELPGPADFLAVPVALSAEYLK